MSAVMLAEIAARLDVLDVACSRCARRGRLRTARLLVEHGDVAMTDLRRRLVGDCPQRDGDLTKRCDIFFQQLVALDR